MLDVRKKDFGTNLLLTSTEARTNVILTLFGNAFSASVYHERVENNKHC